MANVKLKKKKDDGGYEQLYPHTLAKNVMTGTGNVDTDIIMLRQRIVNLEYTKTPVVIEVQEKYSDGEYQFYEASSFHAWHFQNTEANLKIVFNETNRGGNIVIDATDDMGMTMNYPILAGLYDRKFEDGEIKSGKIYDLLYYNYQFYLTGSDSDNNTAKILVNNQIFSNATSYFGRAVLQKVGKVVIFAGYVNNASPFNIEGTIIGQLPYKPVSDINVIPNISLTSSGNMVIGGYATATTRKVEFAQHISFSYITND